MGRKRKINLSYQEENGVPQLILHINEEDKILMPLAWLKNLKFLAMKAREPLAIFGFYWAWVERLLDLIFFLVH